MKSQLSSKGHHLWVSCLEVVVDSFTTLALLYFCNFGCRLNWFVRRKIGIMENNVVLKDK